MPSFTMVDSGEKFPYTGKDYFEPERCFAIPFSSPEDTLQKGKEKKVKTYFFCHTTDLDGNDSSPNQGSLQAVELVSTFNSLYVMA